MYDIYFWGLQFRPRWSERLVTTKYAEMEPEMEPDTEQKGAESWPEFESIWTSVKFIKLHPKRQI